MTRLGNVYKRKTDNACEGRRKRMEPLLKRETQTNERAPTGTFLKTEDSTSSQRPHLVAALLRDEEAPNCGDSAMPLERHGLRRYGPA
ncbi:hypothetical protein NDU88_007708 [Pleurodeles waltl]|uniref:Uncharacterized protein n=1 Tax=Pleurodeles waltl TaxID=8319 RepID=A0AAV7NYQ7_PLEWA|nr:hypothetical protein NDU88_007708 [Pleurodeles waltl]